MDRDCNLAIETSGRCGSVCLGRGDELLGTTGVAQQRRHNLELMPTIDQLCREHGVRPRDLGQVYVSIGPGSFTGLRIAVATARMLALALDVKLVAVPTLEVLAANTPAHVKHVAVGLNFKRDSMYSGIFERTGDGWQLLGQTKLRTIDQLLTEAPRPLALLGDPLPQLPEGDDVEIELLPPELALAHSEAVWQIGQAMAKHNRFTAPDTMLPLYAREPEAVTLWNQRSGPGPGV